MAVASIQARRRGITVLGLLLVIIALLVVGFFLVRYLQTRRAATDSPTIIRLEPDQRGSLR
jgi:flagellar biogenesis protein FliO